MCRVPPGARRTEAPCPRAARPRAWTLALGLALLVSPAAAQPVSRSGSVHILDGDGPGRGVTQRRHLLVDGRGEVMPLMVDERLGAILEVLGGRGHRPVAVRGWLAPAPESGLPGPPALAVEAVAPLHTEALTEVSRQVLGPQPWVTVLCRFADSAPAPPRPRSFFEGLMGDAPPGLSHYWSEVSYGRISLAGSAVAGWYDLPHPRAHYVYPQAGGGGLDFARITEDCTAAAEADVFFPAFAGANLVFSDTLDCCAWGGSWTLGRNGQVRPYRMTWIPSWGLDQDLVAHEMGHGFGLSHSSGPYGATYDSAWDLMSGGGACDPPHPTYGCVAAHPIALHKAMLGWIRPEQTLTVASGSPQTVLLERLAQPAAAGPLMIEVPIDGSAEYFTVESRRATGYDGQAPGPAVLIHRVDPARADRRAQVVDPDGNGDPNDASAMWRAGEAFAHPASGVRIAVVASTVTAHQVSVAIDAFRLTIATTGGGSVASEPPGIGCRGVCPTSVYRPGTAVVLTAAPPPGAPLVTWTGCDAAAGSTCTLVMSSDRAVTAAFAATWTLSAARSGAGGGAVTSDPPGLDCGSVCAADFPPDLGVTLVATPAAGALLAGWGGCDAVAGDRCTATMTSNRTVTARFARAYRLAVGVLGQGRVTSDPRGIDCGSVCAGTYPAGTPVALIPAAGPRSAFARWTGPPACAGGTVTLTEDLTCTAVFEEAPDLVVTAVSNPPATARPASRLSVTDTVANRGARASGPAVVRYYLSAAPVRSAGDRPLFGRRSLPGLAAGASSTGGTAVWLPLGIPPGTYYLLACADDGGAVAEAAESNNCRAAAAAVRIGSRPP